MVAGDLLRGGVKDPKTVWEYEARAAAAKTIRAISFYEECTKTSREFHQIRADATNQEAVEKSKVHASLFRSSYIHAYDGSLLNADGAVDEDAVQRAISPRTISGDLQGVVGGTGRHTYSLMQRECESVGCPTWERRAEENNLDRVTTYLFGLDVGPDNKGALRMIKASLASAPTVMAAQ
eukprot:8080781-Pyramimonas_sp.AAC.1